MSKYDLFRSINAAESDVEIANITNFIENSLSSTTIYHSRLKEPKKVVLTREHKEGNIEIILFTYAYHANKRVIVGDYIKHNHKNFLTFMQYDHPLAKYYSKYKVLECNIRIKVDDLDLPAAYFSAMRSFVNNTAATVSGSANIFENMRPVVVVKDDSRIKVNFRFLAAGEAYRVINIDRISNPGIAYLSVEQTPLNVMTDNVEESKVTTYVKPIENTSTGEASQPIVQSLQYKKGEVITFDIYNGFVTFYPNVEIIKKSKSEVVFRIPYDINELSITTKNPEGHEIITTREVV